MINSSGVKSSVAEGNLAGNRADGRIHVET